MTLHPRTLKVQRASNEIQLKIIELAEAADLTDIEVLQMLASMQQSILKHMLRDERHPDNPNEPADRA